MRTSVELYTVVHRCQQELFAALSVELRNQRRSPQQSGLSGSGSTGDLLKSRDGRHWLNTRFRSEISFSCFSC